jgi:hypothetical protein
VTSRRGLTTRSCGAKSGSLSRASVVQSVAVANFYTTVFLPPTSADTIRDSVTSAMAPYDLNQEPYNGDWEWDTWRMVPLTGFVTIKSQYLAAPAQPDAEHALMAAPKYIIDFDAMRDRSGARATAAWDAWRALAGEHPPARPLTDFAGLGPDEAKAAHLRQPLIQAFAQLAVPQTHPHFTVGILLADPIHHFGADRAAFTQRDRDRAFATSAYLDLDGAWHGSTNMGLPMEAYVREMNAYVDSVPDDTILTLVRCHA